MSYFKSISTAAALTLLVAGSFNLPAISADEQCTRDKSKACSMTEAEKEALEKMSALNENHKLLGYMVGDWKTKTVHFGPDGKPTETNDGSCTTKAVMGGRFFQSDYSSTMMGKPMKGQAITGYDNIAGKFVGTWIDNMSTHIMFSTGSYDPDKKTFTYTALMDDPMEPGTKVTMKEVVRIKDKDEHSMAFFMKKGDKEYKFMDIQYNRAM